MRKTLDVKLNITTLIVILNCNTLSDGRAVFINYNIL